jgi:hypothetical protein
LAELAADCWDIQFITQPPNSPDCNMLDLAFFRAIQSIQYQIPSKDMVELVENVNAVLAALPQSGLCFSLFFQNRGMST